MAAAKERQDVHHNVLEHFVTNGRAPHYTELAVKLGVEPSTARRLLRETTVESPFLFAWMTPETDYVGAWAPFSNLPNQNVISVDGVQKWYGQ
jgi:hypothetical protein